MISGKCACGCSSNPSGTSTHALRNIGRPQNFVSTWLWMRMCRMYFVSAAAAIGGITSLSTSAMRLRLRPNVHLHRLRIEIAGRDVPVLALALVHVQLHCLAIGAMEGLVLVQHRLHDSSRPAGTSFRLRTG